MQMVTQDIMRSYPINNSVNPHEFTGEQNY